jgi:polynucleotide 5'-hydroxyl-kinase GRC3/NOL9
MFLTNVALEAGLIPCIVDSDIGQGDLAPPGVIGGAVVNRQLIDFRDIRADSYKFVGSLSPPGFERIIIRGISELVNSMKRTGDIIVINTDGYVANGGALYKKNLVHAVRADFLIILGYMPGISGLMAGPWRIIRARSNIQAIKSRGLRSRRRAEQLDRFVGKGQIVKAADEIAYTYKCLPVAPSEATGIIEQSGVLFVGLGCKGELCGFGLVESKPAEIIVTTDKKDFDTIYLSKIRANET